jgi:4-hydroxybenzoyl-CoA thioesterase
MAAFLCETAMLHARLSRHVHFGDCDPAQIVFYPRYYIWFDQATENLFRAAGLHWEEMLEMHEGGFAGVPLLGASANFMAPSKMGDDIEIESWVGEWQNKTFTIEHRVHNRGRITVEGHERRIWVVRAAERPAGIRAAPIPAEVKARLSGD